MKPDLPLFYVLVFVSLIMGCDSDAKREYSDDAPRRIEILFLGHDREHHHSRLYSPLLAAALTKDAINITYTEDVRDLTLPYLENFDGVILYANHEDRYPDQEEALLKYIAAGHGFLPIHCASFCFKDSPAYVDLVGGQFKEHGTGIFTAEIIDSIHPAMVNLTEFSTWDETYVHDKIADDIQILMERVDGDHREPWTWTKQYGKGRVFYTAYGHDERTWTHEGFHHLLKEGILWAISDQARANWTSFIKDMPTLSYEDRDSIPNYEKRDPPLQYQLPLSPAQSAKLIQVPPGFDLQLFASEPDIINPIAMNWDEHGRLWVIETVDYPNTVRDDKNAGDDRIKILEDSDGDGQADIVSIFADHLNIPTSFAFINGGILVSQAPHFIFLKDTDGDDRADVHEIILDGWGTFDTHAGPSNLQYGMDNSIHGVVGYSGFKGSIFGRDHAFGQGAYCLDIREKTFEFLTNTSNNTWGLGFTEDHAVFASTANNTHSVFLGIPNRYLTDIEGISIQGNEKIDGHYGIQPITPNVRQVDVFGGFTAAAGHHFYTARAFPRSYWNQTAFVCEPTGGLVHVAEIKKDGAGYHEKDGGNLLASSDEWVSPVEAKVGPDGSVWVADWYNFIVQHNPTPRSDRGGYDAQNGKGNAYINPLRDKSKGRIWKIVPKGHDQSASYSLDKDDSDDLITGLSSDNMFWRLTAQRLLVDRGKTDVMSDLYKLVADHSVDKLGMNTSSLHALWTIEGLDQVASSPKTREVLLAALTHPAPAVRKAAIQILPKDDETDVALLQKEVLNDADPSVQLTALLYFTERPASDAIGEMLYQLSSNEAMMKDPWLAKALYIAACKHKTGFLNTFKKREPGKIEVLMSQHDKQDLAYDDSSWDAMVLPQSIEQAGVDIDGIIWFRKTISVSPVDVGKRGTISLGPIDDADIVFINGVKVGGTTDNPRENRHYEIAANVLTPGKNVIAIQVEDKRGRGGLIGSKDQLMIEVGRTKIPLDGPWKYEVETDFSAGFTAFQQQSMAEVLYRAYQPQGSVLDGTLGDMVKVTTIHIKTIQNEMKYDVTAFTVQAGETVELVLENVDFMQHNLVIVQPGSAEKVGAAADVLATDPQGEAADYIPDLDEVLFATDLVDPEEKAVLRFTVPSEPGDYPFICTFPGHWRIMQGMMKVIPQNSNKEL